MTPFQRQLLTFLQQNPQFITTIFQNPNSTQWLPELGNPILRGLLSNPAAIQALLTDENSPFTLQLIAGFEHGLTNPNLQAFRQQCFAAGFQAAMATNNSLQYEGPSHPGQEGHHNGFVLMYNRNQFFKLDRMMTADIASTAAPADVISPLGKDRP